MQVNRSRHFLFFFTFAGLCFRLKNAAVLKSPNSEPESIYLATRIQMRVNRSRRFKFVYIAVYVPQGLGIQGFYRQGFALCYSSLIYVRGPTVVLGPISQGTN